MGVPAFSWSFLVMVAVGMDKLEGILDSVEHDTRPKEAFDVTSQEAIRAGGANDRRNSSTCSKHPRKISYKYFN